MSVEFLTLPDTFLVFKLGGKELGFEARFLWEAAAAVSLTEVPSNASHLTGVTQLHGKIIPVLDLSGLLEVPLVSALGEFVTVHLPGPPEILAGFEVEAVEGFVKVPGETTGLGDNEMAGAGYIRGFRGAEKKFLWLNIEKIIGGLVSGKTPALECRD